MFDPAFQGLLAKISEARAQGKSMDEMMKMAEDFLKSQPADYANGRRDELLQQVKVLAGLGSQIQELASAAKSGDQNAGMLSMLKLMGTLQAQEPAEAKAAKRAQFEAAMRQAQSEHEKRQAAHRAERLARGLSERAGAGQPEPQVMLYGLPLPQLDLESAPPAPLDPQHEAAVKIIQQRYGSDNPILRDLGHTIANVESAKHVRDQKAFAGLPLGATRIGGLPDLPPGFIWPTFRDQKLPFIAQINLADVPAVHGTLAGDGHLFFFMLGTNEDGLWPRPPVSVSLYRGPTSSLVRAARPADEEIWEDWTGERVYEVIPAADKPAPDAEEEQTVGYLFGEMAEVFGTVDEIADHRFQDGDDWIALLTVYSVGSMQWSDAGELYFFIRKSAMKKLDFSNVIAAACSS